MVGIYVPDYDNVSSISELTTITFSIPTYGQKNRTFKVRYNFFFAMNY